MDQAEFGTLTGGKMKANLTTGLNDIYQKALLARLSAVGQTYGDVPADVV